MLAFPEGEARGREIPVEAEDVTTPARLHDRKADGIRVRHRARRQPLEPAARGGMLGGGREMNGDVGTGVETFQTAQSRLRARAEEGQPMGLGDDEIRGEQGNPACERLAEQSIGLAVMLVAPAAQRDPGAAIDEQASGNGGGARDTVPGARQRTSR